MPAPVFASLCGRAPPLRYLAIAGALLIASCADKPSDAPSVPVATAEPTAPADNVLADGSVDYLLVDKSDKTLALYSEGRLIKTIQGLQFGDAPFGHKQFEGDERTPEGRYTIDTRNPESAFHLSLRISYPNAADQAFAQQFGMSPGGDIFIHGQPNALIYGRVPGNWTDGCIAVSNEEIEELWRLVPDGAVIDIHP